MKVEIDFSFDFNWKLCKTYISHRAKKTLQSTAHPMASQPIDEGGQSPGATEMLGAPEYLWIFSVGTLRTKFQRQWQRVGSYQDG